MKTIDNEQKRTMLYRRLILDDKLETLGNIIYGRNTDFYSFITDEKGKVCGEKVDKFISELIESLEHFLALSGRKIDKDTAEMYKYFLYCAILGLKCENDKRYPSVVYTVFSRTFTDILRFAEDIEPQDCHTYYDYLKLEYAGYRNKFKPSSYFFSNTSESVIMLGYLLVENLPIDVQLQLCADYAKEYNIPKEEYEYYVAEAKGFFRSEEYINAMNEQIEAMDDQDYPDDFWDSEIDAYYNDLTTAEEVHEAVASLGEDEIYSDNELLQNMSADEIRENMEKFAENDMLENYGYWKKNIVDPSRFITSFEEFAKLYFSIDHSQMYNDIKNMIDTFLFEHKLSAFSFGDEYGLITYQIEKMQKRILAEIERRRGK